MFHNLIWEKDKVLVNQLPFWLQVYLEEDIRNKNQGFVFYKDKKLIDMYQDFFDSLAGGGNPKIKNILELGMWDGGSTAFWHEIFKPEKLVGVDLLKYGGNPAFENYKKQNSKTLSDYWETSQTDREKLNQIIDKEFGQNSLDLVFDDASHRYHQSLDSFNIVFPHVKKGGHYIIEDWAWGHWLHEDSSVYPAFTEPTRLIFELVEAAANVGLIENIHICSGFTAVERGTLDIPKDSFRLRDYIKRRPVALKDKVKKSVKEMLGKSV